ncbi:hypothetical protein [Fodinicurvata sp. EGI_FJ10296]|uniref:hypothetical protein n=1 Tax=Fodinicurvata sp. EGI_FJ10296 TaxID=3231908 RepID=UPI00345447CB
MTTASIHTLGKVPTTPALAVDPDIDRLTKADQAALLGLWRQLVKGHFLQPASLSGRTLAPWSGNLLVVRRLRGPLQFEITLCGSSIESALGSPGKGRLVHDLIAQSALPKAVFTGLQQCLDRGCPIYQVIDDDFGSNGNGTQALHLPVGRANDLPTHILTHIDGLAGAAEDAAQSSARKAA